MSSTADHRYIDRKRLLEFEKDKQSGGLGRNELLRLEELINRRRNSRIRDPILDYMETDMLGRLGYNTRMAGNILLNVLSRTFYGTPGFLHHTLKAAGSRLVYIFSHNIYK